MDNELHLFAALLNTNKCSITTSLNSIHSKIFDLISHYESSGKLCSAEGRHRLSTITMDIIVQYENVKMLLEKSVESLDRELVNSVAICTVNLNNSVSSTNPFLLEIEPKPSQAGRFDVNIEEKADTGNTASNANQIRAKVEPFAFDDGFKISDYVELDEPDDQVAGKTERVASPSLTGCSGSNSGSSGSATIVPEAAPSAATITAKFQQLCASDRKKAGAKKYEKNLIPTNFKLVPVEKTTSIKPFSPIKKVKRKHFKLEENEIRVNDTCFVVHVVNPSKFYITTRIEIRDQLQQTINEDYTDSFYITANHKTKAKAMKNIGEYGFAYLTEKSQWFRVQILDWYLNSNDPKFENNALVLLVDFGEEALCFYNYIHELSPIYADFPKMTSQCHLAYLIPPNGMEEWPQKLTTEFQYLIESKRFVISYKEKEGNSYGVELHLQGDGGKKSIGEIMTENRFAAFEGVEEQPEELLEDFMYADNLNEAITGFDVQDEKRICRFMKKNGRCYKGARCKYEHNMKSANGITTDTVMTQVNIPRQEPALHEYLNLLVVYCIDTCRFFAHIITDPHKTEPYNNNFVNLRNAINAPTTIHSYVRYKVYVAPSELVIVKYENAYHRAKYLEVVDLKNSLVQLIDVGSQIVVDTKDVYYMKEDFQYVPAQAYDFILECSQKKDLNKEAVDAFIRKSIHLKTFQAQICAIEDQSPYEVELMDDRGLNMKYVLELMDFINK